MLDLADCGDADNAIAWVSKACQRRRTTTARLAEALGKRTRHRWRELLVDALADVADGVESVLEYRYVRRVEQPHGLPKAQRQQVVISGGRRRRCGLSGVATASVKDCGCSDANNPSG